MLESAYIKLDPVVDGFEGVLVELSCSGKYYVLTETAVGSGNRLMRFSSADSTRVRAMSRNSTQSNDAQFVLSIVH